MHSVFNPLTGEWAIGWPGRVSRHDVVYLSPPIDPLQGMPIGNGDIGVLAWCDDSRVIMVVNKSDLWDEAPFTTFHNWSAEEEDYNSAQRHACRIIVDFGAPVFDVFYLSDFHGRVSLADAQLQLRATGALGTVALTAFVSHDTGLLCCEVTSTLHDMPPVEVSIERYGSRTFGHWYSRINRDPEIGLAGTSAVVDADGMYLQHALTTGTFAVGCRVDVTAGKPAVYERLQSHRAVARVAGTEEVALRIIATVTEPMKSDALLLARQQLTATSDGEIERLRAAHVQAWQTFWLRSTMAFGDDYLDNLWHLTMYYANASQRGKYPGRFINGLWGWNRDVQNWTFYFHWNQQELYWPLNAAGHHDLVRPYLDYRFNTLPMAQEDAHAHFGAAGAWVSDVTDVRGYNSLAEIDNHTPVAQIALDFWRQYRYTGDAAFLRDRALPYLIEAATFFESLFELATDGRYHAKSGTGYEGWIRLRDAVTELACAEALFGAAIVAARACGEGAERIERWQEILDHLAPLPTLTPKGCFASADEEQEIAPTRAGYRFARGPFKGDRAQSDRVFSAGYGIAEKQWMASRIADDAPQPQPVDLDTLLMRLEANTSPYSALRDDMQYFEGIFPSVEIAAVYPTDLIDAGDRGTERYELAANTVKLYGPEVMGWDTLPIVMARLGLADELAGVLQRFPSRWQFYCNGFGHYGPRDVMRADGAVRFRTSQVRDAQLPEAEQQTHKFPLGQWAFRHMGMESMSVLACAMNEALLHSHGGIIRIAPAVTAHQNARFTLHATGGFVVSAEIENGRARWAHIESRHGGTCLLANPWDEATIFCGDQAIGNTGERTITIETTAGERLTMLPVGESLATWEVIVETPAQNMAPKTCGFGAASLGLPRGF